MDGFPMVSWMACFHAIWLHDLKSTNLWVLEVWNENEKKMFSWPYRNHGEQKNLIISQVSTFAEDTKIGGIVDTEESNLSLQKYLD